MSSPPVLRTAGAGSNRARPWIVVADGQRLRQLRRQRGMSQEALADRAGMSVATVGRLERQDRPSCRGRTLARIAAVLGERPAAIMPRPTDGRRTTQHGRNEMTRSQQAGTSRPQARGKVHISARLFWAVRSGTK
jgi:transcriptional regulator with XRE-family HTH domain